MKRDVQILNAAAHIYLLLILYELKDKEGGEE